MNIEYSTSTAVLLAIGAVVLTALLTMFVRHYFANKDPKSIAEKYKGTERSFSAATRNKYPEVDIFALSNTFLAYGLVVAIGLMIVAFSWTTYEKELDYTSLIGDIGDEIEMETPRTAEPPPPPPPPPPTPVAMQIVESELPDIETVEFEDMSIDEDTELQGKIAPPKEAAPPPPPPPPPAPKVDAKEIFKIVEEQPTFKGCEGVADKRERQTCAEAKMMAFIYEHIKYPSTARENNITGMVVVQFVVETDGSISNVSLLRDIGAGCGEEAMRVVKLMPSWNPGKQRGRAVRVMFTLPVRFKLA